MKRIEKMTEVWERVELKEGMAMVLKTRTYTETVAVPPLRRYSPSPFAGYGGRRTR